MHRRRLGPFDKSKVNIRKVNKGGRKMQMARNKYKANWRHTILVLPNQSLNSFEGILIYVYLLILVERHPKRLERV